MRTYSNPLDMDTIPTEFLPDKSDLVRMAVWKATPLFTFFDWTYSDGRNVPTPERLAVSVEVALNELRMPNTNWHWIKATQAHSGTKEAFASTGRFTVRLTQQVENGRCIREDAYVFLDLSHAAVLDFDGEANAYGVEFHEPTPRTIKWRAA